MGFYVVLRNEFDLSKRYVRRFSGIDDVQFSNKSGASVRQGNGFTGSKSFDVCTSIVDSMLAAAATGKYPAIWLSAEVQAYSGECKYKGGPDSAASVAPRVVAINHEAFDGTWRVIPPRSRKSNVWVTPYAFVHDGVPVAGHISADTEINLIEKIFNPDDPLACAFVQTLPISDPATLDQLIAPSVVTDAALAAVQPMDRKEFDAIPGGVAQRRYLTEPLFRKAVDFMEETEERAKEAFARKQAAEDAKALVDAAKRKLGGR